MVWASGVNVARLRWLLFVPCVSDYYPGNKKYLFLRELVSSNHTFFIPHWRDWDGAKKIEVGVGYFWQIYGDGDIMSTITVLYITPFLMFVSLILSGSMIMEVWYLFIKIFILWGFEWLWMKYEYFLKVYRWICPLLIVVSWVWIDFMMLSSIWVYITRGVFIIWYVILSNV